MNKKMIFNWMLVIIWACVIFIMSSMDTNESNDKSKSVINEIVEKTVETTKGLGITNKTPSESKIKQVIEKLNYPLRKVAHASEYFIFTLLIIRVLKNSQLSEKRINLISLLICFIYACTDEYHQTFVNGRTGQFTDIMFDMLGGSISCIIYFKIKLKKKNQTYKNLERNYH